MASAAASSSTWQGTEFKLSDSWKSLLIPPRAEEWPDQPGIFRIWLLPTSSHLKDVPAAHNLCVSCFGDTGENGSAITLQNPDGTRLDQFWKVQFGPTLQGKKYIVSFSPLSRPNRCITNHPTLGLVLWDTAQEAISEQCFALAGKAPPAVGKRIVVADDKNRVWTYGHISVATGDRLSVAGTKDYTPQQLLHFDFVLEKISNPTVLLQQQQLLNSQPLSSNDVAFLATFKDELASLKAELGSLKQELKKKDDEIQRLHSLVLEGYEYEDEDERDPETVAFEEFLQELNNRDKFEILDEEKLKEWIEQWYQEKEAKNALATLDRTALLSASTCQTPSSVLMTATQLYDCTIESADGKQKYFVYRESMLRSILLSGALHTAEGRSKYQTESARLDAVNYGFKGFWDDVWYAFDYKTAPNRKKPVIVCARKSNKNTRFQLMISFYGTESLSSGGMDALKDWISNFSYHACPIPGNDDMDGYAHGGFANAAESCRAEVINVVRTFIEKNNTTAENVQVIFAGHSLGAAVAFLSAIHLLKHRAEEQKVLPNKKYFDHQLNKNNNVVVMNMGQPRVLRANNKHCRRFHAIAKLILKPPVFHFLPHSHYKLSTEFTPASWYETLFGRENILRIAPAKNKSSCDKVTHLPGEFMDYKHIGTERLIAVNRSLKYEEGFHDIITCYQPLMRNDGRINTTNTRSHCNDDDDE